MIWSDPRKFECQSGHRTVTDQHRAASMRAHDKQKSMKKSAGQRTCPPQPSYNVGSKLPPSGTKYTFHKTDHDVITYTRATVADVVCEVHEQASLIMTRLCNTCGIQVWLLNWLLNASSKALCKVIRAIKAIACLQPSMKWITKPRHGPREDRCSI